MLVASGVTVQFASIVRTVAVFEAIVRYCPAPVPDTICTMRFAKKFVVHAREASVSEPAAPALAVPYSLTVSFAGVPIRQPSSVVIAGPDVTERDVHVLSAQS